MENKSVNKLEEGIRTADPHDGRAVYLSNWQTFLYQTEYKSPLTATSPTHGMREKGNLFHTYSLNTTPIFHPAHSGDGMFHSRGLVLRSPLQPRGESKALFHEGELSSKKVQLWSYNANRICREELFLWFFSKVQRLCSHKKYHVLVQGGWFRTRHGTSKQ